MPENKVIEAFPETPPVQEKTQDINYAIGILSRVRKILNVTVLAFVAQIGALGIFGYTTFDPSPARITAATLYAVTVLFPALYLYLKKV